MPSLNEKFLLAGKLRKEVIISPHNMYRAVCQCFNIIFSAFYISQVDQHLERLLPLYDFFQIPMGFMGITDDQNLHSYSSLLLSVQAALSVLQYFPHLP